MRFFGRFIISLGSILMVINVIATVRQGSFQKEVPVEAPALAKIRKRKKRRRRKTPLVRKNAVIFIYYYLS